MLGVAIVLFLVGAALATVAVQALASALAGPAALPAALRMLRERCVSVQGIRLFPTPRCGRIEVRLLPELGGGPLFSAASACASEPLWRIALGYPFDVAVTAPEVHAELEPATLAPRALLLLSALGLASGAADAGEARPEQQGGSEYGEEDEAGGERDASAAAGAADASATAAESTVRLPAGLSLSPVRCRLVARVRAFTCTLHLGEGTLLLPDCMTQVLGTRVSLYVAAGARALAADAAALRLPDTAWAAAWPAEGSVRGRGLLPLALRAEAEHGTVSAHGFWTTAGFSLAAPADAALDFTPALVSTVLGQIHPLLSGAIQLEEDDAVRVALLPAGMHVPASRLTLRVAPLRLQIKPNPLILGSLALVGRFNRPKGAGGKGAAGSRSAPPDCVEAQTSAIVATLHAAGWVDSGRLDMLVSKNFAAGAGECSCHMAMWGTVSLQQLESGGGGKGARTRGGTPLLASAASPPTTSSAPSLPASGLDMTLAIMTDSLGLPPGPEGRPAVAGRVRVKGTADDPQIAWLSASRDMAAMVVEATAVKGLKGWLTRRRERREAAAPPPPPPAGVLPWEARLQRAGASRRDDEAGAPAGPRVEGKLVRAIEVKGGSGKGLLGALKVGRSRTSSGGGGTGSGSGRAGGLGSGGGGSRASKTRRDYVVPPLPEEGAAGGAPEAARGVAASGA